MIKYFVARDKKTGKVVTTLPVAQGPETKEVFVWLSNRLKPELELRVEDAPR